MNELILGVMRRTLVLIWVLAVGLLWVVAAIAIGGYLLARRVLRPREKWPEDEWLDRKG